jgi:hypothetical protein
VFHEGERLVQQRTRELATADRHGAMIKSALAPAWARFLEQQPLLALGSRDERGAIWASVLLGQPTGGTRRFLWVTVARWREGPACSG